MAIQLTHTTVATGANDPSKQVSVTAWNESHTLTMAASRLLGRGNSGAGNVQEIELGANLSFDGATIVAESYPIGAVYISYTGTDPATELGYGSWQLMGTKEFASI